MALPFFCSQSLPNDRRYFLGGSFQSMLCTMFFPIDLGIRGVYLQSDGNDNDHTSFVPLNGLFYLEHNNHTK